MKLILLGSLALIGFSILRIWIEYTNELSTNIYEIILSFLNIGFGIYVIYLMKRK